MKHTFCLLLAFPLVASAAVGEVAGEIDIIRSHETTTAIDWVSIKNVSAGNCTKAGSSVAFLIKDDERGKRHLAIATAAKMANKSVAVGFDDVAFQSNGWCYLRYIDLR